jgi:hypothetical protein
MSYGASTLDAGSSILDAERSLLPFRRFDLLPLISRRQLFDHIPFLQQLHVADVSGRS